MNKLARRFFKKHDSNYFISGKGTEIKVLFSSENPSLIGNMLKTQAIEISPKRIRLEMDHAIELNSVLDIALKPINGNRQYNLTGNIRWCLPVAENKYQCELVLRERMDIRSDLSAWKANFNQNFAYYKVG